MNYGLPKTVEVGGEELEIRSDYRAILDILVALADPDLDNQDRAEVLLTIFYTEPERIPLDSVNEAVDRCLWFINCGQDEEKNKRSPRLMDWEQDFFYIAGPVSRVVGQDVRGLDYLHWWSFMSAYQEIGDCTFAHIVRIRSLKAKGKRLDKADQEFYRENRNMIKLKAKYTEADNDIISQWV
jgi:hypothetical protein